MILVKHVFIEGFDAYAGPIAGGQQAIKGTEQQ